MSDQTEPRVAHALCPRCHPHDPTEADDGLPPTGTTVTRWCGAVVPLGDEAGPDAARCDDCARPYSTCATCGATATPHGVHPPPPSDDLAGESCPTCGVVSPPGDAQHTIDCPALLLHAAAYADEQARRQVGPGEPRPRPHPMGDPPMIRRWLHHRRADRAALAALTPGQAAVLRAYKIPPRLAPGVVVGTASPHDPTRPVWFGRLTDLTLMHPAPREARR